MLKKKRCSDMRASAEEQGEGLGRVKCGRRSDALTCVVVEEAVENRGLYGVCFKGV